MNPSVCVLLILFCIVCTVFHSVEYHFKLPQSYFPANTSFYIISTKLMVLLMFRMNMFIAGL